MHVDLPRLDGSLRVAVPYPLGAPPAAWRSQGQSVCWHALLRGLQTCSSTVLQANGRRSYAVRAAVPEGLREQQKIADAFFAERLLPRRVNAVDVPVFKPGSAT